MELERRRQQRKDQKETTGVRSIHDLPNDLLGWILLRLDSSLWFIRAACACKRWCGAVTDGGDDGRAFLRLASSLHPPTVVVQYHNKISGDIRFVPALSPIDGSRFSVDFLDKDSPWHVADCHGGLVLLSMTDGPCARSVPDLIVYDPLTRKHRWISCPPTRNEPGFLDGFRDDFLLDGDDGHISISNFKVLHRRLNYGATDPHQPCVYSRDNGGEWDWRFLSRRLSDDEDLFPRCSVYTAGRVDGSLYLRLLMGRRIIAIDSTSLVFSIVDLPTRVDTSLFSSLIRSSSFRVVHGVGVLGPTSPQKTSIVHVYGDELELFRRVQGSGEWVLEHTIANLSEATRGLSVGLDLEKKKGIAWRTMVGVMADGAAFAIMSASSSCSYLNDRWFLSIDVNTMELRVLLPEETYRQTRKIFNYTLPWPCGHALKAFLATAFC